MWTFDSALSSARKKLKYEKFKDALYILRTLEKIDPNDPIIQFEIARCLIHMDEFRNDGKEILIELLDSDNRDYAMFELGKIELDQGNKVQAWIYFEELLNATNNEYAVLELGKLELEQGNKEGARKNFKLLLNTDNDEYAMLELGKLNVTENKFDKTLSYFEKINESKIVLIEKVYLNIRKNNYEEAYKIFKANNFKSILDIGQISQIRNYLKYQLRLINKEELPSGYFYSQLTNYDEDSTLEHIKLHLDENDNKRIHSTYDKYVNINIVYEDVKYRILDINPTCCSIVDKYIVDYDYTVAKIDGCLTDKLEIVTLPNTKKIITMYPIPNIKENIKLKQMHK